MKLKSMFYSNSQRVCRPESFSAPWVPWHATNNTLTHSLTRVRLSNWKWFMIYQRLCVRWAAALVSHFKRSSGNLVTRWNAWKFQPYGEQENIDAGIVHGIRNSSQQLLFMVAHNLYNRWMFIARPVAAWFWKAVCVIRMNLIIYHMHVP